MSLKAHPIGAIPQNTKEAARAVFPKGNVYVFLRDQLGTIVRDEDFADLFSPVGQPALAPWRLVLICLFQYLEGLSDRQAAEAVRERISWKYALSLDLHDRGFDASVLCEFRQRLVEQQAAARLLDRLLELCLKRGWIKPQDRQRTDSTHVLSATRLLNRLEVIGETIRASLEVLAVVAPNWLREWVPADWKDRYDRRFEISRFPLSAKERQALGLQLGRDGLLLLTQAHSQQAPEVVRLLPQVQILQTVWQQQYVQHKRGVRLRLEKELPPASERIESPYDADARYASKRSTEWTGYKVHLTETCEPERPHLITQVQTVAAPEADFQQTSAIQEALCEKGMQPQSHLVDAGYPDAQHLVSSQQRGIQLVGPVRPDRQWQASRQTGYAQADFVVDWQAQRVHCPQGKQSVRWVPDHSQHNGDFIQVSFAKADCAACSVRSQCTRAKEGPRHLALLPQAEYEALQEARRFQQTEEFKQLYKKRAGVEGTISQTVRVAGLRQARYRGIEKLRVQHLLTAAAINVVRLFAFFQGRTPEPTRTSHFAALMALASG